MREEIAFQVSQHRFNDLVIATIIGAPVRVQDIGWTEDGTKEQRSVVRLDDVPTVMAAWIGTRPLCRQTGTVCPRS